MKIQSTLLGILIALVLGSPEARALTLDARTDIPATRAQGRVVEARSERGADGILLTHVVLADETGHEVARFVVPGGREGRVQWVVEGMPAFTVGQQVDVALTPSPLGTTVTGDARPAAAESRAIGAGVPSVTDLVPWSGGAVPDDPAQITVLGSGFGASQADSRVAFLGVFQHVDAAVVSWSDSRIVCRVPAPGLRGTPQVLSGSVKVWTAGGGWSDGNEFVFGASFSVLYQWAGDSWPNARLPLKLYVNPAGSPYGNGLAAIATDAATQWNTPGSYARFEYGGLTAAQGGSHNSEQTPRDGRNTVIWRAQWPYDPQILMLTWSAIDTLTLERQEVETEINGTRPWTLDPEAEPNKFDLPSTLTHEFGHWLRLGHTQSVPSVMVGFVGTGDRNRQISVGDSFGASWIHPSYGVATVPAEVASGATLTVPVTAFDREGKTLPALFRGVIEVRAVPLVDGAPGPLDAPLTTLPAGDVNADIDTDIDGKTTATLAALPDGLYRVETFVLNHFVRPASIVRVGAAPVLPAPVLALSGVTPSPLQPGVRGVVHFSLPTDADIRLELFDARGRRVREVAAARYSAGPHELAFETMGADGRELTSGVYFLRLAGATLQPQTSRVVVLR